MDTLIISITAFLASLLTLFSGFGLGSLLMPVFAIFFPVEVAIPLTAWVHFFNNLFKLLLVGRHARWNVVLRFGVPALLASFAGAWMLHWLASFPPLWTYSAGQRLCAVTPVKIGISLILLSFIYLENFSPLKNAALSEKSLSLGGVISGFFSGLSGHQGAVRSLFLMHAGLSPQAFIGTGTVIACLVDISRLGVYQHYFLVSGWAEHWPILSCTVLFAFLGAWVGSRFIGKMTNRLIHYLVTLLLIVISLALLAGLI
jgi:uncharacterized protein